LETPAIVQVANLEKTYRLGNVIVHALRGVNFTLQQAEFVVITGPSGSGKTTLLNIIGTLDKPSAGKVTIDGEDITSMNDSRLTKLRRHKLGFIFQFHNLIPVLTALENVELPLLTAGTKPKAAQERASLMLERVGLRERLSHLPDELSGGEQQRVAIARALSNHPKIILADEPTGDLDTKTGSEVVQIMYDAAKTENASVLVVTHDPVVEDRAEKLYEMRDGIISKASQQRPHRESYRLRAIEPVPPEPARSLSQPN
jgi:putative ABC transport system ATP-binding protein